MEAVCDKKVADILRKKAISVAPDTPVSVNPTIKWKG
jgi:hypothetical protein